MKYRGFGDPRTRIRDMPDFLDSEYNKGSWERDISYTTAPGTKWMWPRCSAVGGKTNLGGRSSARFGDIDFKAATLDGYDADWPVTYDEVIRPHIIHQRTDKLGYDHVRFQESQLSLFIVTWSQ